MVKLCTYQAQDGDFFWVRYKSSEESTYHNLVVDGGRKSNADDFCEMLEKICEEDEKVDAIFLTHFDQDHIMGMFRGIQKAKKKNCIPKIESIYLNTGKGYLQHHKQCKEIPETLPEEKVKIPLDTPGYSANDVEKLVDLLQSYNLEKCLKSYITQSDGKVMIGGAGLYIISPSEDTLLNLIQNWPGLKSTVITNAYGGIKTEWESSLDELMLQSASEDGSISNGASIAFLFEFEQTKIAFLGDAHPSVCVDGLLKLGYSEENPCMVDIVKISHHGSKHNCTEKLLHILKSKRYLLSTDGRDGRLPDKLTIAKMVKENESVIIYCNYGWWEKLIYRRFFTEEDKKRWIDTKRLQLIELSTENAADNIKNGFELYGARKTW